MWWLAKRVREAKASCVFYSSRDPSELLKSKDALCLGCICLLFHMVYFHMVYLEASPPMVYFLRYTTKATI